MSDAFDALEEALAKLVPSSSVAERVNVIYFIRFLIREEIYEMKDEETALTIAALRGEV